MEKVWKIRVRSGSSRANTDRAIMTEIRKKAKLHFLEF